MCDPWAARPSLLAVVSSKYVPTTVMSQTPVVGSGGTRIFTYSAKKKGKGTLRLVYRRGTDSENTTPFTLRVTVR